MQLRQALPRGHRRGPEYHQVMDPFVSVRQVGVPLRQRVLEVLRLFGVVRRAARVAPCGDPTPARRV